MRKIHRGKVVALLFGNISVEKRRLNKGEGFLKGGRKMHKICFKISRQIKSFQAISLLSTLMKMLMK